MTPVDTDDLDTVPQGTASAAAPRRIHPIVALDYGVRRWANLLVLVVLVSCFLERPATPWWVWTFLVLHGLAWAPLARWIAQRAVDSREAEHRNLLIDAACFGALSGLVSFALWPSAMMLGCGMLSILSLGGAPLARRGLAAWGAGALLGAAVNGFGVQFETSLRTSLFAVACFVPYLLMFGIHSHAQAQRALAARREVIQRNEQITLKNRQLELARMLADSANRTKSAFLANMSHELRTPLNAIIGYSELLESEFMDIGEADHVGDVQKIRSAGVTLLAMVEGVLNLSKMEAGEAQVFNSAFLPDDLVASVAEEMREEIERNGNSFTVTSDVPHMRLLGDHEKIREILAHLLSNAGKFTRDGQVALNVRHEADTQMLVIQVDDSGIGIAAAQRDALFRPFAQADSSTTRRFGGSGLGLAITRHYCELMGGSIEVNSQVGAGAHFTVRVPAPVAARRDLAHA
ncbi:ATP-binding protein [Variovorax sp. J22P168]|uniref:ATP-binding protein n=1 Tax=Variovorax jilinensis TaxID=3053513 RepID=UPI002575F166|nr:ATP-binding protein [Variovorax sp. J22P168]MDM0014413.1 ATP-binding protein [Variovorax sp. J22P168]